MNTTDSITFYDGKTVNAQAFGAYIESIAKERENKLINADIFTSDNNISETFGNSRGSSLYAVIPMLGDFDGVGGNYDGETDIDNAGKTDTYYYGVTSYGRYLNGEEKDFANDLVPGQDFLEHLANKMGEKWVDLREDTLISIIKGIFSSTTDGAGTFASEHTLEIDGKIDETSANNATQKACGDKDGKFNFVIMHSKVANTLRNKKLLDYVKYTTPEGLEMNTNIAQWGTKTVLVDDSITTDTTGDTTKYITYLLGKGAFKREDGIPVEMPFERYRDPHTNGGKTELINRERRVLHPAGFSYLKKNQATKSPTDTEFADGANWGLAKSADGTKFYPHKLIPIARIISTEVEA